MERRLLVIADDLTGALDTGVRFSRAGVPTHVTTSLEPDFSRAGSGAGGRAGGPESEPPVVVVDSEPSVVVVDIESRHLPPDAAAARVRQCARSARAAGIGLFYKKTDSTLRGNVGAELSALLSETGGRALYFVPALPEAGRITRGGIQLVDGVPVHLSQYGRDLPDPAQGSSVSAIIGSQSDTAVACVPRGADPGQEPAPAQGDRATIFVLDAETEADLEWIAGRLASVDAAPLVAGCSGFASMLPRLFGLSRGQIPALVLRPPLLVVCGSLNEVSLAQVREAEARGIPSWNLGARDAARAIASALRGSGVAILKTADAAPHPAPRDRDIPRAVERIVRGTLAKTPVGTIAAFGGDAAFAVIEALGAPGLRPVDEISQGVVACRLVGAAQASGARSTSLPASFQPSLVAKAGGFGPVDVVKRIQDRLARED